MNAKPLRLWLAIALGLIVAGMLGASFAAVPLYKLFCQVTGYGGATQKASAPAGRILDRRIDVRLDANVSPGLAIQFKPEQISQSVRFGETAIAYYTVTNTSNAPVRATASYNVAPHKMGQHFQKLECFCFVEQTFAPGETRELAVIFYVAPEAAEDWDTREVETVTLSYTFYEPQRLQANAAQAQTP